MNGKVSGTIYPEDIMTDYITSVTTDCLGKMTWCPSMIIGESSQYWFARKTTVFPFGALKAT